jgi:beta-glucosidase
MSGGPPDEPVTASGTLTDDVSLPPGFLWGTATWALGVEGDRDHRGPSMWDGWAPEPAPGDGLDLRIAADHITRLPEDVELLRRLGVGAHRFSLAWSRILPDGVGLPAPEGLAFYDRLVDALLEAGIEPWATLYHGDLPEVLLQDGGWPDRGVVDRFVDYSVGVHAALGDRIRTWTTMNSPWAAAWLGHGNGSLPPGVRDRSRAARAAHHLLLAHGRAVAAMRAQAPADHQFGLALDLCGINPGPGVDPEEFPHLAKSLRIMDGLRNRWWLGALVGDGYPEDVVTVLAAELDGVVLDGDLDEIGVPLDFLGVDYRHDTVVTVAEHPALDGDGSYPGARGVRPIDPGTGDGPAMTSTPHGLTDLLMRIGQEYPDSPPLVVSGNGIAVEDEEAVVDEDGPVPDPLRVDYLRSHVVAVARAVAAGADVRGYFVWSLMDGIDCSPGYDRRFGLVRVDGRTRDRLPRRSFEAYRELIAGYRGQPVSE